MATLGSATSPKPFEKLLRDGDVVHKLAELLFSSCPKLRGAPTADFPGHSKFFEDGGLEFGNRDVFYRGLDGFLGPPNPNLDDTVRNEHCREEDAEIEFTVPNYKTVTTSKVEYWFVADPLGGLQRLKLRDWPGASRRRPSSTTSVGDASSFPRKARPWSQLEPAIQLVNERLAARSVASSK